MRISDWSSDVCSSDLQGLGDLVEVVAMFGQDAARIALGIVDDATDFLVDQPGGGVGNVLALGDRMAEEDLFRSEEHTSELQSLMRISYAVFCLKKKNHTHYTYS